MKHYLFVVILLCCIVKIDAQRGVEKICIPIEENQTIFYEESHALIIGISKYINGWSYLPGVKKDIDAIKDILEQKKFIVELHENIAKDSLDEVFSTFIAHHGQNVNNRLLFYFAGHGHTLKMSFGENIGYIVPVDAPSPLKDRPGFQKKALPMSRIIEYAKTINSKHALFLFDACFSGTLFSPTRAVPEIISYKTARPVRLFITSGSEDEVVPDESIFRQQFETALSTEYADFNNDGYLTGSELGKFLQDNVVNYSSGTQHPQYGKIRNPNLDKGDIVFVLSANYDSAIKETCLKTGQKNIDMQSYYIEELQKRFDKILKVPDFSDQIMILNEIFELCQSESIKIYIYNQSDKFVEEKNIESFGNSELILLRKKFKIVYVEVSDKNEIQFINVQKK